jgi:hypothetical protein
MKSSYKRLSVMTLASAILLVSCTDETTTGPNLRPQFSYVGEPALVLLKTYGVPSSTFELSATSGSLPLGEEVTMGNDVWTKVWEATENVDGEFTAIDKLLDNAQVDSVFVLTLVRGADGTLVEGEQTKITGTNQIAMDVGFDNGGYIRVFKSVKNDNPADPQGCTPAFYRKRRNRESWPDAYPRFTSFNSVFINAFPGETLLGVLRNGGRGKDALGRHAVAALLNAASPNLDYPLTVNQVVYEFNRAILSRDARDIKKTKKLFHELNQKKCRVAPDTDF